MHAKGQNILVLGAGVYQTPLIKAVQTLGYRALVASIKGPYPGFEFADETAYIDTRDKEGLLALARSKNIVAAVTAGTDVSVGSLGCICDNLHLCGVSEAAAELATNKVAMKKAFAEYGVATADFRILHTGCGAEACAAACEDIGYPAIVKAVDSSGSRGIVKAYSRQDVERAYNAVHTVTQAPEFIVEKLIVGIEFGMQLLVQDGRADLCMPHGDYLFEGAGTAVPFGHFAPFDNNVIIQQAQQEAAKLVNALGINNAAVNVDAIFANDTLFIIEAGARVGATGLAEIVSVRHGIDYYQTLVRLALGEHVSIPQAGDEPYALSMLIGAKTGGLVSRVETPSSFCNGVELCDLDIKRGDCVRPFNVGPDRIGLVITSATSLEKARTLAFETIKSIGIWDEDGNRIDLITEIASKQGCESCIAK